MVTLIDPVLMPIAISFLLVFAIVLGLLSNAKIFGNKNVNIIIAFVFGIFAVSYEPFVSVLQEWIPIVVGIFLIVFVLKLIKTLFSSPSAEGGEKDYQNIGIALTVLLLIIAALWSQISDYFMLTQDIQIFWIIAIIVIAIVFIIASKIKNGGK